MRLSFSDLPRHAGCVLVDGAFDPLHAGHIAYLEAAHDFAAEPLICAVASDADILAKGRTPLLPEEDRVFILDALWQVGETILKDRPTEQILEQLQPRAYIKGADWKDRLPEAQVAVCARLGIPIHFVDTVTDSSTKRLQAWRQAEDATALDALERTVQTQRPAETPWQPVTDYSFEARKAIEGQHPQLIKDVFQPSFAFDIGCGPDEILCRLLRDIGVHAKGMDPQGKPAPDQPWRGSILDLPESIIGMADLIICREVLEHLTIRELRIAVTNLCAISSRFIYVTTRFAKSPSSLLSVDTADDLDPTHITLLNQDFLRTLFVLEGCTRRRDLEARMDWQHKGRVLVYQVPS